MSPITVRGVYIVVFTRAPRDGVNFVQPYPNLRPSVAEFCIPSPFQIGFEKHSPLNSAVPTQRHELAEFLQSYIREDERIWTSVAPTRFSIWRHLLGSRKPTHRLVPIRSRKKEQDLTDHVSRGALMLLIFIHTLASSFLCYAFLIFNPDFSVQNILCLLLAAS